MSQHEERRESSARSVASPSRRTVLGAAAAGISAAVLKGMGADPTVGRKPSTDELRRFEGRIVTELGERAPFEKPKRLVGNLRPSSSSQTPLQDLRGIITPADLHYERHHAGVPLVDPATYELLVHGLVSSPKVFTLADLKRFPSVSVIRFLECSGNGSRGYNRISPKTSPQLLDGLTSTSNWIGVPLALVLREVGVKAEATWFLAESYDGALYSRSIPVSKAWDDALIAYGQNGEPLRPENGYPARLFLPGWEGSTNIKWLRRLELSDRPFMTREETSKYTDPLPDGTARMFSFDMDAKSVITFPAFPTVLPSKGFWEVTGLAWSGRGKIARVEVSVDGGKSWKDAELEDPVLPKCHTRFNYPWTWDGRDALLMSRAIDETGYVQPMLADLKRVRGEGTAYHQNNVRAWRVQADGQVFFGN
ncbi:MAG: sulfite dehydrogenase [Vicinamibacterales bacterium]